MVHNCFVVVSQFLVFFVLAKAELTANLCSSALYEVLARSFGS